MRASPFRMLYTDIGGVLGTNGWDSALRRRVCAHLGVAHEEVDRRHQLIFDSFERGFMTFEEYLQRVFFSSSRKFTLEEVRDYAYQASTPWPESINFFRSVKTANRLRLGLISNEGEGIAQHRVNKFGLRDLADFMVISHFTRLRKPDREIWRPHPRANWCWPIACSAAWPRRLIAVRGARCRSKRRTRCTSPAERSCG